MGISSRRQFVLSSQLCVNELSDQIRMKYSFTVPEVYLSRAYQSKMAERGNFIELGMFQSALSFFYVELNICLFIAFQIKGFVVFKVATISLWPRRSCGSSCSSEYWGTFHTDDSEHFPFCWQRWNECDFGYSKVRNPCSQRVLCYFWHFNFFFLPYWQVCVILRANDHLV